MVHVKVSKVLHHLVEMTVEALVLKKYCYNFLATMAKGYNDFIKILTELLIWMLFYSLWYFDAIFHLISTPYFYFFHFLLSVIMLSCKRLEHASTFYSTVNTAHDNFSQISYVESNLCYFSPSANAVKRRRWNFVRKCFAAFSCSTSYHARIKLHLRCLIGFYSK